MKARAVFLDRDGVLNLAHVGADRKPHPPARPHELAILSGVESACAALHAAGLLLIVVTNQPDVARGVQQKAAVETMHTLLRQRLPVDDIRVCYHDDTDGCGCRKPEPGLLISAAKDWAIDLAASFMVGDRWRDIEAGERAGCTTVLVGPGYDEGHSCYPDLRADSLAATTPLILQRSGALP